MFFSLFLFFSSAIHSFAQDDRLKNIGSTYAKWATTTDKNDRRWPNEALQDESAETISMSEYERITQSKIPNQKRRNTYPLRRYIHPIRVIPPQDQTIHRPPMKISHYGQQSINNPRLSPPPPPKQNDQIRIISPRHYIEASSQISPIYHQSTYQSSQIQSPPTSDKREDEHLSYYHPTLIGGMINNMSPNGYPLLLNLQKEPQRKKHRQLSYSPPTDDETEEDIQEEKEEKVDEHKQLSSKKHKFGPPRFGFPFEMMLPHGSHGMSHMNCEFGWCGTSCCPLNTIQASALPGSLSSPHPLVLVVHPSPSSSGQCAPACQPMCLPQCSSRLQYSIPPYPLHENFFPMSNPGCRSDCMPGCHVDCLILPPATIRCLTFPCRCASGYFQCSPFSCCTRYQNMAAKLRSAVEKSMITELGRNATVMHAPVHIPFQLHSPVGSNNLYPIASYSPDVTNPKPEQTPTTTIPTTTTTTTSPTTTTTPIEEIIEYTEIPLSTPFTTTQSSTSIQSIPIQELSPVTSPIPIPTTTTTTTTSSPTMSPIYPDRETLRIPISPSYEIWEMPIAPGTKQRGNRKEEIKLIRSESFIDALHELAQVKRKEDMIDYQNAGQFIRYITDTKI